MITYVLFHRTWEVGGSTVDLIDRSEEVTIDEYTEEMRGHIFCPRCNRPTFRVPADREIDAKGRRYFSHARGEVECEWRVKQVVPFFFNHEQDVERAIADRNLVVVERFLEYRPENLPAGRQNFYDEVPVDQVGADVVRALSRHRQGERAWPTRITTMRSIVRNFDRNLDRYYSLPDHPIPIKLRDALFYIGELPKEPDEVLKRIYYGRITQVYHHGRNLHNVADIDFAYPRGRNGHADAIIKTNVALIQEYGITEEHVGLYVLAYGLIRPNGVGVCIPRPSYGEIAVLPQRYTPLIEEL